MLPPRDNPDAPTTPPPPAVQAQARRGKQSPPARANPQPRRHPRVGAAPSRINHWRCIVLNKVMLIGRLGKDPEFRTTPNGIAVASFSLATDEKRKSESGELTQKTEWHRIVAFRRTAEIARDYLRKGSLIYLEGKLHYDSYENKEGVKVYKTEITCDDFRMLESRSERGGESLDRSNSQTSSYGKSPQPAPAGGAPDSASEDEDLPF
jgi:single-strand DNA-binding protein